MTRKNPLPFVSVIIPTYNYAHYIVEAIDSVLNQDYPLDKIEIIVVDDGSTDKTREALKPLIETGVITYIYQQNDGKASATSSAVQHANGKYIFNLDADDYFLPGKIKRTVELFEKNESVVHVASPAQIFSQDENIVKGSEELPTKILERETDGAIMLKYFYNNNILYGGGSTFAARSAVLKQVIIPPEVDMYIDEFLLLTVLPHGKSFFFKQPLSVWRVHSFNYSGNMQNAVQRAKKAQRLLKSSDAVLAYLKENKFDKFLIKIYTLKNSNRVLASKEAEKTKGLEDILGYAKEVFFNIRPRWNLIRKYHVLNRLMPLPLYQLLKKITNHKYRSLTKVQKTPMF